VKYLCILGIDVCALCEELIDEVQLTQFGRKVEGGPAILRWGSGEAVRVVVPGGVTVPAEGARA
jgi:hypothetical protein